MLARTVVVMKRPALSSRCIQSYVGNSAVQLTSARSLEVFPCRRALLPLTMDISDFSLMDNSMQSFTN